MLLHSNLHPKLAKLQGNHSCYQAFPTNPKLPQPLPSILPPRYHNHAIFTRLAFLSIQSVASGWKLPTAEWFFGMTDGPHTRTMKQWLKRMASWWVEGIIAFNLLTFSEIGSMNLPIMDIRIVQLVLFMEWDLWLRFLPEAPSFLCWKFYTLSSVKLLNPPQGMESHTQWEKERNTCW